ncbi:MAG: hypothetical protein AAFN81_20100 [Bacteroidota bacterium]
MQQRRVCRWIAFGIPSCEEGIVADGKGGFFVLDGNVFCLLGMPPAAGPDDSTEVEYQDSDIEFYLIVTAHLRPPKG